MESIRSIRTEDAEALRELYASIVNEGLPYILKNTAPSVEDEEKFIRSVVESGGMIFVSVDSMDRIVGMLTLNRLTHPQLHHRASFGISVSKIHRNIGLGERLILQAIDWCKECGIPQLSLEVLASNPAVSLYERLGFRTIGENAFGIEVDGEFRSVLTMALLIP